MESSLALRGPRAFLSRRFWRRLPAWWSHVAFRDGSVSPPDRETRLREGILVVAAALLFFTSLDCPLQEPEETLYAEIPRQMLAEGRLLVPVRHGQDYYDKPPLLYWLQMGAYQLFGVHDRVARLVPCAAAFLCVLVSYWWAKRTAGARAAFLGAMMLCLAPRFAQMARMLTMNSLLTLWVLVALATAHLALTGPRLRRRWWLASALACGLGVMTKGPVAFALVAVPVWLYQRLDRRSASPERRQWLIYAAMIAALSLPWFVLLAARDPVFLPYFVWTHHIRRFLDPIDHPQPFWYYGPLLFVGMLPWPLLVPLLFRRPDGQASETPRSSCARTRVAFRPSPPLRGRGVGGEGGFESARDPSPPTPLPGVPGRGGKEPAVAVERPAAAGFFLLAGVWSFVFFSASVCKRPSYILPVMPPLALALGCYVDAAISAGRMRLRSWSCVAAATFVALLGASQFLLPGYADKYSLRAQIAPHAEECAADVPVMCYPHGWDGVNYYLQRQDVRVFHAAELDELISALGRQRQSLVVVKSDAALQSFREALPRSLEFVQCSCQVPVAVGWVRRR